MPYCFERVAVLIQSVYVNIYGQRFQGARHASVALSFRVKEVGKVSGHWSRGHESVWWSTASAKQRSHVCPESKRINLLNVLRDMGS